MKAAEEGKYGWIIKFLEHPAIKERKEAIVKAFLKVAEKGLNSFLNSLQSRKTRRLFPRLMNYQVRNQLRNYWVGLWRMIKFRLVNHDYD